MEGPTAPTRPRALGCLLTAAMILFLTGCGSGAPPTEGGGKRLPDTFTFFDVNANSVNDDALRSTLRGHLGREAVAGKDILDLAVFPKVSLSDVLPKLGAINRQLNPDPRARKEHAISSLAYRYPQTHYPTFTFVRLVFSANNLHPLMIIIDANNEAGSILETLTAKYGPPRVVDVEGQEARLWSWEREGDQLVVHKHRNKFGRPAYLIAIFYVARIDALLAAETVEESTAAGRKTAF